MSKFASISTVLALASANHQYHGHQVYRAVPIDQDQVIALRDMDHNDRFDFWTESRAANIPVDIRCSQSNCAELESVLDGLNIKNVTVMIEDLQLLIDHERKPSPLKASSSVAGFDYSEYHGYQETEDWMQSLVSQYGDICEMITVGTSYQGREIHGIKITGNKNAASEKKAFWMDGGLHAREWITVSTVTYMLGHTLQEYGTDNAITSVVDAMNLYYVPILNPDGYEYTRSGDRMWRKTMKPNPGQSQQCAGTDPNRNWDWHWNEAGSSSDPCSESYAGARAADQPEVKAVMDYLRTKDNFLGYMNFHSYSQLWMSPWGYTYSHPKDYDLQHAGGAAAVAALEAVHGTRFQNGAIAEIIYQASGSSADYAYGACNILFSYGAELRDTGSHGFVLPASQIIPSGEETYAAIKALAKYMISNDPTPPAPSPPSPGPTPAPTPLPHPTPQPSPPGHCHAISAVVTDDWCVNNCALSYCPADLCADCGASLFI